MTGLCFMLGIVPVEMRRSLPPVTSVAHGE
jgi:hypothetical protein